MLWKGFPSFILLKKEVYGPLHKYQSKKTNLSSILSPSRGVLEANSSSSSSVATSITSL